MQSCKAPGSESSENWVCADDIIRGVAGSRQLASECDDAPVKLVYTNASGILVAQVRNNLELAGIRCVMRNEYASGALGELAPIDAWPEVWALRDRDFERAQQLLLRLHTDDGEVDWQCASCGNDCPAAFEFCWHCASDRYAPTAPQS